ncbi:MAG TPA: tripartite tricarboxylate transporter substrate-binding protein, partial [Xanthobacteraceae bacterium]|nr:tripartite tricarboxylate transporter substrate-binding protein [Xanthobacteraceae bacterium]
MRALAHPILIAVAALGTAQALVPAPALAAWEPTRPVEFIVPAGTGGGADQMARTIQGIVTKHNLMKQPMVVINKSGGAGGEGFLDVKGSRNNPHKLIITLSNLFTTPLATGIPFNWKDMTPVAMMALDEFILWVNAESPYKSVKEYIEAA